MASNTSPPTLLFLDLPPKTFVGIDLVSFNSSPNFHGITNLPVGFHFLYTSTDASLAIRNGRWLNIPAAPTSPQVYVFKWSHENESLNLLDYKSDLVRNAVRSMPELRTRGLVNYDALHDATSEEQRKQAESTSLSQSDLSDWVDLTSHISAHLLSRVLADTWTISSISSAPSDSESIPGLTHLEASSVLRNSNINVTPIDLKQTWPDDAIGRDRTDKARDRSWYLGHLIEGLIADRDRRAAASELLAELQMCFLMVLTLANYSCLEQWKRILAALCTCRQALLEVEGYFVEVLKVLQLQLRHVEDVDGGLFEMKDEANSAWLRQLLAKFRRNVDEMLEGKSKLGDELKNLEHFMQERYGWESGKDVLRRGTVELEDGERIEVSMDGVDEEEETGDYAPLVVEI